MKLIQGIFLLSVYALTALGNSETLIENCTPYSKDACKAAAAAASNLEWKAAGNYGTKGCYAYHPDDESWPNQVYYGIGGTVDAKKKSLDGSSRKFRPEGHDCKKTSSDATADSAPEGWFYENCEPFTKEACRNAAKRWNYRFQDSEDSGSDTKGCYAYFTWIEGKGGKAYFNPAGSEDEMTSELLYSPKTTRIRGDDCRTSCHSACKEGEYCTLIEWAGRPDKWCRKYYGSN